MPSRPPQSAADPALEQAFAWLARLNGGGLDAAGLESLSQWRDADPAHERAWRKAQSLWEGMEGLRGRPLPGSQPLPQESASPRLRGPSRPVSPRRRNRRLPLFAAACAGLLAVGLAWLYPPAYWRADYVTAKGEQREIVLPDGSRVCLNTSTLLALHFEDTRRRLELLEGEAYFEVAKDASRPFEVTAAEGSVRAVGTAFAVRRQPPQLRVELLEGIVEVKDPQGQHGARLAPGQTAEIGPWGIRVDKSARPDALAAWKDGYLLLDGLALVEAVAQINRYRPGRVLLLNEALAGRRVSGLFRLDGLDQAVDALAAAVSARKQSVTPYLVLLR